MVALVAGEIDYLKTNVDGYTSKCNDVITLISKFTYFLKRYPNAEINRNAVEENFEYEISEACFEQESDMAQIKSLWGILFKYKFEVKLRDNDKN